MSNISFDCTALAVLFYCPKEVHMIKVKITKNVINKSVSPLGSALTPRLIVCTVIGLAAAIATFFALKDSIEFNALMWIVFAEIALFVSLGIQINGVGVLNLLFGKQKDIRPFNRKGVFNDENESIF